MRRGASRFFLDLPFVTAISREKPHGAVLRLFSQTLRIHLGIYPVFSKSAQTIKTF